MINMYERVMEMFVGAMYLTTAGSLVLEASISSCVLNKIVLPFFN